MRLVQLLKAPLLFVVMALFASCQKEVEPPVAAFDIPSGEIKAGVDVVFTNNSQNATSVEWDFGDQSTIVKTNDREVTHNFREGGNFNVKLIAKNGDGSHGISKAITVTKPAVALAKAFFELSPSTECPAPCKVTVTNKSENASTYTWTFTGGTPPSSTSNANTIEVTYSTPGDYTITLVAKGTAAQGQHTYSKTIKITATPSTDPKAGFDFSGADCVVPCTVNFVNTSTGANAAVWNFGDGSISNEESPKHQYTTPGAYIVFLIAQNGGKNDMIKKVINVYGKCLFTKHIQIHPVTGTLTATYDYNTGDFPTQSLEVDIENSGSKAFEIKQTYSYKDNYITSRTYTINLRNDNQQYVDETTGNTKYTYNSDGLLSVFEVTTIKMRDRNNAGAGTTTSKSTTAYSYHPNYMLARMNADGILYDYSETGELVKITPAANNGSEVYQIDDSGVSRSYKTLQYNLRGGRIARVEFSNGAYQDWSYDGNGQISKKTFTAPDLNIVDIEEWTYDNQKAISSLNRVFLGHPTYTVQGRVASNELTHTSYRTKNGTMVGRKKIITDVTYSQYNSNGYPEKSNLYGGDNTYQYRCR